MIAIDIPNKRVAFGGNVSIADAYSVLKELWYGNGVLQKHDFPITIIGGEKLNEGCFVRHTYLPTDGWTIE